MTLAFCSFPDFEIAQLGKMFHDKPCNDASSDHFVDEKNFASKLYNLR